MRAFSPLDDELELLPGTLTPRLIEGLTHLGTWMPFAQAAKMLERFTSIGVSEATARRWTLATGEALVVLDEAVVDWLEEEGPTTPRGPALQQVSVDGAMVPLVGKAAWAEVRTVAVGTINTDGTGKGQASGLSYFSRLSDAASFIRQATVETHRRGTDTAGQVVAVNDGADWIQDFIDTHRHDAIRIIDWGHSSSYVHEAGHAAHGRCGDWCTAQLSEFREGDPARVIAAIRVLEQESIGDEEAQASIRRCLGYLEKRLDQLRYADFSAEGLPIGSGIAESANKLVVEVRLKGSGMHWLPANVNPMLALRNAVCSDRWDRAWRCAAAQTREACRAPAPSPALSQAVSPPVPKRPKRPHPWRSHPAVRRRRAKS